MGLRKVVAAHRVTLTSIFNLVEDEALQFDDHHEWRWLRTHLPVRCGGTGQINLLDISNAAYIGMVMRAGPFLRTLLPSVPVD